MNTETWQTTFGSVIRFLLAGAVGYLVNKGVVTTTQGEFLITEAIAGALAVATLVWVYLKNKAQAKLVKTALEADPTTTSLEVVKTRAAMSE